MATFTNEIYDGLLQREGGYRLHTNRGEDTETYAGLYRKYHEDLWIWNVTERLTDAPDDEVKETIRQRHQNKYWDECWLEQVDDENRAVVVFDMAVNAGVRIAIKLAQKVCYPDDSEQHDGRVGPITIRGINGYEGNFVGDYSRERKRYYNQLARDKPEKFSHFLQGWLNRVDAVEEQYSESA